MLDIGAFSGRVAAGVVGVVIEQRNVNRAFMLGECHRGVVASRNALRDSVLEEFGCSLRALWISRIDVTISVRRPKILMLAEPSEAQHQNSVFEDALKLVWYFGS